MSADRKIRWLYRSIAAGIFAGSQVAACSLSEPTPQITSHEPSHAVATAAPTLEPIYIPELPKSPTPTPRPTATPEPTPSIPVFEFAGDPKQLALEHLYDTLVLKKLDRLLSNNREKEKIYQNFVNYEASLYRACVQNDQVVINSPTSISIEGKEYDLNILSKRAIASALIETRLMIELLGQGADGYFFGLPAQTAYDNIKFLDEEIEFDGSDDFTYLSPVELSKLGTTVKTLKNHGLPYPTVWVPNTDPTPTQNYDSTTRTVEYNPNNLVAAIGAFYRETQPDYFQAYLDILKPLQQNPVSEDQFDDISVQHDDLEIRLLGNELEAEGYFDQSFAAYLLEGAQVWGKIEALKKDDKTELGYIIEQIYFLHLKNLKLETSRDGQEKIFVPYTPGLVMRIVDSRRGAQPDSKVPTYRSAYYWDNEKNKITFENGSLVSVVSGEIVTRSSFGKKGRGTIYLIEVEDENGILRFVDIYDLEPVT